MSLELVALGRLDIHAEASWSIADGPRGTRSVTAFEKVIWSGGPISAHSLWANGTYLGNEKIAEPNIRALFETEEEKGGAAQIFLEYHARFPVDSDIARDTGVLTPGSSPVFLAGRVETSDERYAWLNATQIVGKGGFDMERLVLSYDVYALR